MKRQICYILDESRNPGYKKHQSLEWRWLHIDYPQHLLSMVSTTKS